MSETELMLLHLSDIHFHKRSGCSFDLDVDLRLSMETEAGEFIKKKGGRVHGIIITGDVVYSGKKMEYEKAENWLTSLCEKLNCPEENIWTVPGNHDVDWDVVDGSPLLQGAHKDLRSNKTVCQINSGIEKYFCIDKSAAELMHRPLHNYMGFNKLYEGSIKKDGSLYWEYDLPLNDGSLLRIRGLNSTLVSSKIDNAEENKLFLGEKQVQLPMSDKRVCYLTMCHHPLDWLKDRDTVEVYLNNRAVIQLFGHKHNQFIMATNKFVRIVAGATHPEREDSSWLPRYNFLGLSVSNQASVRKLIVNVYTYIWSKVDTKFIPDFDLNGSPVREYALDLPLLEFEMDRSKMSIAAKEAQNCDEISNGIITSAGGIENPYRKLVYRFHKLAFNVRHRIALDLHLVRDEDEGIEDADLFKNIFLRARDERKLELLWQKIEEAHGNRDISKNSFKGI